ncbi:TolC family protein [Tenacibaculum sp. M341]|nr:TolC family protein [Tenacibaculum sp. M341]
MQKISLCTLSLIFLTQMIIAQESWSLDRCINYAVNHNLSVKKLKYSEASGLEVKRQSYRNLLPSIVGNTNYSVRGGRSIDPGNNTIVSNEIFFNNYSVNGSVDIFSGWRKINSIASAKFIYTALSQETLQEKYLLAFRVMQQYYDVLYFKEAIAISEQQKEISEKNYESIKRQKEIGIKAGVDVYTAKSTLVSDKLKVTQAKNNLKLAKIQLKQEMNFEGTLSFIVDNVTFFDKAEKTNKSNDIAAVYGKAITFIPSIKASEARMQSAKKELAISRGALAPSLSFLAGYSTGYFETRKDDNGNIIPFSEQLNINASNYIGLDLDIPIFQSWKRRTEVKQKKIALLQAENDLDIQKQELRNIIEQLLQNYDASKSEYEQTLQQERERALSFEIAQKKYDNGLINVIDLNTEKNLYATAQNQHLQVKLKLKLQEQTLAFYNGIKVFNIN